MESENTESRIESLDSDKLLEMEKGSNTQKSSEQTSEETQDQIHEDEKKIFLQEREEASIYSKLFSGHKFFISREVS